MKAILCSSFLVDIKSSRITEEFEMLDQNGDCSQDQVRSETPLTNPESEAEDRYQPTPETHHSLMNDPKSEAPISTHEFGKILVFSVIFSLLDVLTDLVNGFNFFLRGETTRTAFTFVFCFTPVIYSCMEIVFSYGQIRSKICKVMNSQNSCVESESDYYGDKKNSYQFLFELPLARPLRNSYLLGILSKSEMNNKTITDEITYGTRLEVFCESVPQLVLQFYYFSHGQELGFAQYLSIVFSLASILSTSILMFLDGHNFSAMDPRTRGFTPFFGAFQFSCSLFTLANSIVHIPVWCYVFIFLIQFFILLFFKILIFTKTERNKLAKILPLYLVTFHLEKISTEFYLTSTGISIVFNIFFLSLILYFCPYPFSGWVAVDILLLIIFCALGIIKLYPVSKKVFF